MPRKLRLSEPGLYHVLNRGVERRDIYLELDDYDFFLDLLYTASKQHNVTIHSFCLMTNHYHILLETKENNLSKLLQHINDKYSKYFNKKYKRIGPLWQGRFKSYPLYDDAHFWIVVKYIERNPIKANIVGDIDSYMFQSYFQWRTKHKHFKLLSDSKIFNMTLDEYTEYIGTQQSIDAIDTVYKTPKLIIIDNKITVLDKRLKTFFEKDRDINRNENMKKAFRYGYSKSEIAKFMHLNHSTVSRLLT